MSRPATRILSRGDVAALLDEDACRGAVEDAFLRHGTGEAPAPAVLGVAARGGGFHVKAGILTRNGRPYFAAKVNGNFFENERYALPRIQGVICLADAGTGAPLAIMDSALITELRTAAATAVAAKLLARPGAGTVTICGCGVQGRAHLRALTRVLSLARVFVFDADAQRAERFAEEFSSKEEDGPRRGRSPLVLAAAALAPALRDSDVVVACTPSKKPYLFGRHVKPGAFVAAVGADAEDKQEVDASLLASAKVVTDVTTQCAAFGDLHHAIRAGAMTVAHVHAELGEIVAGRKPGRTSDDEVVVFDSTGVALQDVAAAAAAFEAAERAGRGLAVDLLA